MGYIVWGECAGWGIEYENLAALGRFASEWTKAVQRDFNHPSIVVGCPLNEVWENLEDSERVRDVRFVEAIYKLTKTLDSNRPCVDTSGGYHGRYNDLFDFHCYHGPETLAEHLRALEERSVLTMDKTYAPLSAQEDIPYDGPRPVNAGEYGGVAYGAKGNGWGYRTGSSEEEFVDGYVKLTELLLSCGKLSGFCYTQLYAVEQEQNGLYSFDRKPKLSENALKRIAAGNGQTAKSRTRREGKIRTEKRGRFGKGEARNGSAYAVIRTARNRAVEFLLGINQTFGGEFSKIVKKSIAFDA